MSLSTAFYMHGVVLQSDRKVLKVTRLVCFGDSITHVPHRLALHHVENCVLSTVYTSSVHLIDHENIGATAFLGDGCKLQYSR